MSPLSQWIPLDPRERIRLEAKDLSHVTEDAVPLDQELVLAAIRQPVERLAALLDVLEP